MHEWRNRCPWRLRLDMMFKAKACHREASLGGAKRSMGYSATTPTLSGLTCCRTAEQRGGRYSDLEERLSDVDDRSTEYLLRTVLLHAAGGSEEDKRRLKEALEGVGKSQGVGDVRD